jgi:hypothetical protein
VVDFGSGVEGCGWGVEIGPQAGLIIILLLLFVILLLLLVVTIACDRAKGASFVGVSSGEGKGEGRGGDSVIVLEGESEI